MYGICLACALWSNLDWIHRWLSLRHFGWGGTPKARQGTTSSTTAREVARRREELQFLSALAVGQRVGDGNHELRVHVYFLEWFVALWFVFLWSNKSWNLNRRLGMASLHFFFRCHRRWCRESSSKRILGKCSRRHWADEGTRKMNHPEFSIVRVCMAVGRKEKRVAAAGAATGITYSYLFYVTLFHYLVWLMFS